MNRHTGEEDDVFIKIQNIWVNSFVKRILPNVRFLFSVAVLLMMSLNWKCGI